MKKFQLLSQGLWKVEKSETQQKIWNLCEWVSEFDVENGRNGERKSNERRLRKREKKRRERVCVRVLNSESEICILLCQCLQTETFFSSLN